MWTIILSMVFYYASCASQDAVVTLIQTVFRDTFQKGLDNQGYIIGSWATACRRKTPFWILQILSLGQVTKQKKKVTWQPAEGSALRKQHCLTSRSLGGEKHLSWAGQRGISWQVGMVAQEGDCFRASAPFSGGTGSSCAQMKTKTSFKPCIDSNIYPSKMDKGT